MDIPQMPFGAIAAKASKPANLLPPLPAHGKAPPSTPPPSLPPAATAPPMAPPPAGPAPMGPPTGLPSMPPPGAPTADQSGMQFKKQADGSYIFYMPSPDGNPSNDVYLSKPIAPPKLPVAFQPPQPPAQ